MNEDLKLTNRIPVGRVKALLEDHARRGGYDLSDPHNPGGHQYLERETGLKCRRIYAMVTEEQPSVTLNVLEKIINNTNRLELRWMSPEDGGFADIFDGEHPELAPITERQQQRLDASRARNRRNKERRNRELEQARRRGVRDQMAGSA